MPGEHEKPSRRAGLARDPLVSVTVPGDDEARHSMPQKLGGVDLSVIYLHP